MATTTTLSDAWIDFAAGWCSGAVSVIACQPVDTILTRWQAQTPILHNNRSSSNSFAATGSSSSSFFRSSSSSSPTSLLSGASSSTSAGVGGNNVRSFTRQAGMSALWRGSTAMISAVPIQNMLLMGGYGVGLRYSELYFPKKESTSVNNNNNNNNDNSRNSNQQHWMAIFVGGFVGGILQSFVMSPVELIKVSQQCSGQTAGQACRQVWKGLLVVPGVTSASSAVNNNNNNKTFAAPSTTATAWRGLGATLLRDGIPHGVWFVSYEMCKDFMTGQLMMMRQRDRQQISAGAANNNNNDTNDIYNVGDDVRIPLVSGAVAATVAWVVGYPADLIKTRIQAAPIDITGNKAPPLGIWATASRIVEESPNGLAGLYRGFGLKLVRSVPASMIGFSVYEWVKKRIEKTVVL